MTQETAQAKPTELDIAINDLEQRILDYDNKITRLTYVVSKLKTEPDAPVKELINDVLGAGSLDKIKFLSNEIDFRNVRLNSLVSKLEEVI